MKLYLYGLCFISTTPQDIPETHHGVLDVFTRDILQRGLTTASRLLSLVLPVSGKGSLRSMITSANLGQFGATNYVHQFISYPKQFFLTIAFANFFLLWFLATDPQASHTDKELARNFVSATYRFFMSFTNSPEHIRYGKTIEVLGRMPNLADANITVRRSSRLGASFLWEVIRRAMYYREATRLASEAQRSSAGNGQPGCVVPSSGSLPAHQVNTLHHRDLSQHVSVQYNHSNMNGYGQHVDHSAHMAMEGLLPDPSTQIDQTSLFHFEDIGDWDIPWGVWDDAAFDALGFDLNTTPPYDAASLLQ